MSAVRRQVEELQASLRRAGQIANGSGLYAATRGGRQRAVALDKAMRHELDTLAAIVAKLDKATAPRPQTRLGMPREGTVARTVLQVLHLDALGHDHDGLRELAGLTDAGLASRITGAGINSVRPRRVDLVRAGWVTSNDRSVDGATYWTLTPEGRAAMDATLDASLEEVASGG